MDSASVRLDAYDVLSSCHLQARHGKASASPGRVQEQIHWVGWVVRTSWALRRRKNILYICFLEVGMYRFWTHNVNFVFLRLICKFLSIYLIIYSLNCLADVWDISRCFFESKALAFQYHLPILLS